jgi:3-isopropylmalate/(R)-2-methylmalate dehydratase small subunit
VKPVRCVSGGIAVLDRPDVDTDQIIPKQFLKSIARTGFEEALFAEWMEDPGFELRRPEYAGARILVAGPNFGCGSSREHAAWALRDYGFDVIIAPSFSDIFRTNAFKNGLLVIELRPGLIRELMDERELTVDLEASRIVTTDGHELLFEIDDFARHCLLNVLDDIALTLEHEDEIAAYEARVPACPGRSRSAS